MKPSHHIKAIAIAGIALLVTGCGVSSQSASLRIAPRGPIVSAGPQTTIETDDAIAFSLFHQAAKAGNADAQLLVAGMLSKGQGVIRDEAAAAQWYRKAAEQGDPTAARRAKELASRL